MKRIQLAISKVDSLNARFPILSSLKYGVSMIKHRNELHSKIEPIYSCKTLTRPQKKIATSLNLSSNIRNNKNLLNWKRNAFLHEFEPILSISKFCRSVISIFALASSFEILSLPITISLKLLQSTSSSLSWSSTHDFQFLTIRYRTIMNKNAFYFHAILNMQ